MGMKKKKKWWRRIPPVSTWPNQYFRITAALVLLIPVSLVVLLTETIKTAGQLCREVPGSLRVVWKGEKRI